MKDFNYWKNLYESEKLEEFSSDNIGLLWLKTKSIVRKELIADFLKINEITLQETSLAKQFIELFDLLCLDVSKSQTILDEFIRSKNQEQIKGLDTTQLVSELYKLKNFEWGGDYQNSLDKYLVSRYVKVHKSFDTLMSKFETEISGAVQGYVLCSWYKHWSSILIEHIFNSNQAVLPTVGQIKGVDFFINDVPFDLKVTYLPVEYIKLKRKQKFNSQAYEIAINYVKNQSLDFEKNIDKAKELKNIRNMLSKQKSKNNELKSVLMSIKESLDKISELTYLKHQAKKANINYDKNADDKIVFYEITEKMKDRNDEFCADVLKTLKNEKLEILREVQRNPKILATWLYENQGEMRFGSENRLFLLLVDTEDFDISWKLQRNLELLRPTILQYLDNFKNKKIDDLKIMFGYKSKSQTFTALTDIIFVVK